MRTGRVVHGGAVHGTTTAPDGRVRLADGRVLTGVASGLAEDGALCLRTERGLRTVHSARVVAARPLIMRDK